MHDKTSQVAPLEKRFYWVFRKHFGNANTVRTSLSITLLSGFGIILLMAVGTPFLPLVILGTVAAVTALMTVVSGLKSFFDYVAERHNEVTDETIEGGFAVPQYHLGLLYYKGEGVNQNYETAVGLFRLALQGNVYYVKSELQNLYRQNIQLGQDVLAQPKITHGQEITDEESEELSQGASDDEERESGEDKPNYTEGLWKKDQSGEVDSEELGEEDQDTDKEESGDEKLSGRSIDQSIR